MEIRIYNPALGLQGVIDEFSSLIWVRLYQQAGEFELHTPYAQESKRILLPENIVQKFDGGTTSEAGVIEHLEFSKDEIVIKGRFLESYLDRRLIKDTTYYTGSAETSMRAIISDMVPLPRLELGQEQGLTEELTFQATFKAVSNIIEKTCRATALGYRIRPDFTARKVFFEVYKGTDRTASAAEKVIFSESFDNLMNESYIYDSVNYKTMAFASQLVNDVRVSYPVGGGTGLDLREMHAPTSVDTDGRTTAQIKESMETQGRRALEAKTISEGFTFSTDADAPFRYRTDYDLGDLVRIRHNAWNIDIILRITEIEEDYGKGAGRDVFLTTGSPQPEIIDFEEG